MPTGPSEPTDPADELPSVAPWLLAAARAACVLGGLAWWAAGDGPLIDPTDAASVARGEGLYREHCASCHVADLAVQPNWRVRGPDGKLPAPPHDTSGHTWHHPDAMLFGMVKEGFQSGRYAPPGYRSDMPGYGDRLTDEEIVAVLAYIKSTWPEAQRAHQAALSRP